METWYKERGGLGRAPDDLEIYEVALWLHQTPDTVRQMSMKDVRWIKLVKIARNLAFGSEMDG